MCASAEHCGKANRVALIPSLLYPIGPLETQTMRRQSQCDTPAVAHCTPITRRRQIMEPAVLERLPNTSLRTSVDHPFFEYGEQPIMPSLQESATGADGQLES